MPRFTISEPHPTVVQNAYMHSGRGGAGNYFRAPTTTTKTTVTTTTTTTTPNPAPPTSSRFYSGRGGAGNARVSETRPVMSFDEELRRGEANRRVGYVGRGGAGNAYDATTTISTTTKRRKDSDGASASSSGSAGSLRERVSSVFGRR